jgi:thiamine-phosphate diphosphorylase
VSAVKLPPALVAVSPGDLGLDGAIDPRRRAAFLATLEKCCRAGLRALLVREPALLDRALLELARDVRTIVDGNSRGHDRSLEQHASREREGWLGLHDRVHLAAAAQADAVHLGHRSLEPAIARTILDPSIAIGFSAHEGDDLAHWRASDYVFFGPVLDTASKRGLKTPVGFAGLAAAVRASPVPVWAIGGLKPEHAAEVRASEARGVAVLSGIFVASDPAAACAEYLRAWSR